MGDEENTHNDISLKCQPVPCSESDVHTLHKMISQYAREHEEDVKIQFMSQEYAEEYAKTNLANSPKVLT